MNDDVTLCKAVQANPNDEVMRLVYADWLEDHGDVRADFLRLLVAIKRQPPSERRASQQRLTELRAQIDPTWFGQVMSIADRFYLGDTQGAWDALIAVGDKVREAPLYQQAIEVSRETMLRVSRNLDVIVGRLDQLGYLFANRNQVHVPPADDVVAKLDEIERGLQGPLPLSLRAFWEIVGSVDCCQSQDQMVHDWFDRPDNEIQQLGDDDPLYVESLQTLRDGLTKSKRSWCVSRREGRIYFQFAPDCFHKANVSGGENYHVYLPDAAADFRIVGDVAPQIGEDWAGDYFVHYLRRSVLGGGFRGRLDVETHQWLPRRAILESVMKDLEDF
jgi:uncharacterized protein (TIGR02996 family)